MVWPSTAARVAVPLSTVSIMYDSIISAVEALMHCRAVRVLRRLCTPPAAPRTERTSCGSTIVPPLPTAPGDHRQVHGHGHEVALAHARPGQLALVLDRLGKDRLVDDQVLEEEVAVKAHALGRGAEPLLPELQRELAEDDVAGLGKGLLQGEGAVPLAVGVDQVHLLRHGIGSLAGEDAVLHPGQVLQRAGQGHDLKDGAGRIAPCVARLSRTPVWSSASS